MIARPDTDHFSQGLLEIDIYKLKYLNIVVKIRFTSTSIESQIKHAVLHAAPEMSLYPFITSFTLLLVKVPQNSPKIALTLSISNSLVVHKVDLL